MPFDTPIERDEGYVVPHTEWNQNTVTNPIYLHSRLRLMFSGIPFVFGGSRDQGNVGTGYPSGAGYDTLVPWSGILRIADCSVFAGVTMALEAMLLVESGATATLSLFNLTDGSPNTALTNSTITSTSTSGGRARTASAITLPTSGTNKDFGVKLHSAHASLQAWAWGIRLFPVD